MFRSRRRDGTRTGEVNADRTFGVIDYNISVVVYILGVAWWGVPAARGGFKRESNRRADKLKLELQLKKRRFD